MPTTQGDGMVQDAVAQAAQEGHLAQPRGWGARGSLGEGFIEAKRLELRVKGKHRPEC